MAPPPLSDLLPSISPCNNWDSPNGPYWAQTVHFAAVHTGKRRSFCAIEGLWQGLQGARGARLNSLLPRMPVERRQGRPGRLPAFARHNCSGDGIAGPGGDAFVRAPPSPGVGGPVRRGCRWKRALLGAPRSTQRAGPGGSLGGALGVRGQGDRWLGGVFGPKGKVGELDRRSGLARTGGGGAAPFGVHPPEVSSGVEPRPEPFAGGALLIGERSFGLRGSRPFEESDRPSARSAAGDLFTLPQNAGPTKVGARRRRAGGPRSERARAAREGVSGLKLAPAPLGSGEASAERSRVSFLVPAAALGRSRQGCWRRGPGGLRCTCAKEWPGA